jgi:hypothetical protein
MSPKPKTKRKRLGKLLLKLLPHGKISQENGTGTILQPDQDPQNQKEQASGSSIVRTDEEIADNNTASADFLVGGNGSVKNHVKRDLWEEAFQGLDESQKKILKVLRADIKDKQSPNTRIVDEVIKQTKEKYAEYKEGGMIRRSEGKSDIDVRDKAYKILDSALSFQSLVGAAVKFDPTGHGNYILALYFCTMAEIQTASAAWSILSLGLNV